MITTIGMLTAMLLPVLAKAKANAMQANCTSNLRGLNTAWTMYHSDNGGRLVESYPVNNPSVWIKGDMRDERQAEDPVLLEQGKLTPYLNSVSAYRCPSDRGVVVNDRRLKNVRSYSMNSFMGGRPPSVGPIPLSASGRFVPFFTKDSDIERARPSDLWVLIDEDSRSNTDGFFITDPTARVWHNFPSIAAYRHKFRYTLTFADGHADSWQLRDPRTKDIQGNEAEQAGNVDLEKLARVSTILN